MLTYAEVCWQVDDFIKEADADRSGSVDRREFIAAAARLLLASKVDEFATFANSADPGQHWLHGLQYRGARLRLFCRSDAEWLAMCVLHVC